MDVMRCRQEAGAIRRKAGMSNRGSMGKLAPAPTAVHMPQPHSVADVQREKLLPGGVKFRTLHRVTMACIAGTHNWDGPVQDGHGTAQAAHAAAAYANALTPQVPACKSKTARSRVIASRDCNADSIPGKNCHAGSDACLQGPMFCVFWVVS